MKINALKVTLVLIMITGLVFAGCEPPIIAKTAGPVVTRSYDITDFNSVDTGHDFQVDITASDTYSIVITTNEEAFEHINVYKTGDTLKIDPKDIYWQFHNLNLKAEITMPELHGLNLSGASQGNVKGFQSTDGFDLSLSGASELDMDMGTGDFVSRISGSSELTGNLTATSTVIDLSGDSHVKLAGSGGIIRLIVSGSSDAELENFTVNDADIKLSGSSDASLDIKGRLDATLSGSSFLEYSGNPTLGQFNVTGSSSFKRRETK